MNQCTVIYFNFSLFNHKLAGNIKVEAESRYEHLLTKVDKMNQERLMFDTFIELKFEDKPTKIIYKAVAHENILLIQHVTVLDKDEDLGVLDIINTRYPGPRYESLSRVSF